MSRPCSFNYEGNRLYCLTDGKVATISKGYTIAEGSRILSLPYGRGEKAVKLNEEDFVSMEAQSTAGLHVLLNGVYTCIKTSEPANKRAGSDKVTFLLRKHAIRNSLSKTLKQACEIQGATTEKDFANMRKAYKQTKNMGIDNFFENIVHLGCILDPLVTTFRKGPAVFNSSRSATSSENIKGSLSKLHGHLKNATIPMLAEEALEYYYAFEEIHPLQDGNGRVGMLLYNILLGPMNAFELPEDKPSWN